MTEQIPDEAIGRGAVRDAVGELPPQPDDDGEVTLPTPAPAGQGKVTLPAQPDEEEGGG